MAGSGFKETIDAESSSETVPAMGAASSVVGVVPGRGQVVGRYFVLSRLGAGAMGVVLAAYDPELDRQVALKLLKVRAADQAASRLRLQREAGR